MSPELLQFFSKYIETELGIVYSTDNHYQLQSRLKEVSEKLGCATIEEFYAKAKNGIAGPMRQLLLDMATNNETHFFRDAAYFEAIRSWLVEEIFPKNPATLRIWSAAASFGQEALSVSILLQELKEKMPIPRYEILGTDICQRALARATTGVYTEFELKRGLNPELLNKYFKAESETHMKASASILSPIRFESVNLLQSAWAGAPFDLILCRNMLIYQRPESKAHILSNITRHLQPEGRLVLGAGESMIGISDRFESVSLCGAVLYKFRTLAQQKTA